VFLPVEVSEGSWILPPMVIWLQYTIMFASIYDLEKTSVIFLKSSNFNDPIKSAQSATHVFRFFFDPVIPLQTGTRIFTSCVYRSFFIFLIER
jgi:hypothetical protein